MTTRNMCCLDAYVMELFEMQAFERNLLKLRDLKSSYCLTLDMELLLIFNNGWYNLRLFKCELVHLIETLVYRMTLEKREKKTLSLCLCYTDLFSATKGNVGIILSHFKRKVFEIKQS